MSGHLLFFFCVCSVIIGLCFWSVKRDDERRRNFDYVGAAVVCIKEYSKTPGYDPEVIQGAINWAQSHRDEVEQMHEGGSMFVAGTLIRQEIERRLTSGRYHKSRGRLNEKGEELLAQYERLRLSRRNLSTFTEKSMLDQEKDKLVARLRRIG